MIEEITDHAQNPIVGIARECNCAPGTWNLTDEQMERVANVLKQVLV